MSNDALSTPGRDQQIAALEVLLAERDAALADARAELQSRDLLIQTLRVQIARLRQMQFGRSSEKLDRQIEQLELALEELEAEAATVEAHKAAAPTSERPAAVRALPAHLPREEGLHEPATGSCACRHVAACCVRSVATRTSCSPWSRSAGTWCVTSAPSTAAARASASCRRPLR